MSISFCVVELVFFFFNDTATTEIYTLSLHDALPISVRRGRNRPHVCRRHRRHADWRRAGWVRTGLVGRRIAARGRGIRRGLRLLRLLRLPCDLPGGGGVGPPRHYRLEERGRPHASSAPPQRPAR